MHGAEQAILADHVMRFGRDRSQRRTPQHVFVRAIERQQIREIGMPARKLLDRNLPAPRKAFPFEVSGERGQIQLLFGADCAGVG